MYDVVAVDMNSNTVRLIAKGKTLANAEAIVAMAVMRRGIEEEFFAEVQAGKYRDGDQWASEARRSDGKI